MIALISSKNQLKNLKEFNKKFKVPNEKLFVVCFYKELIKEAKLKVNPDMVIFIPVSPFNNPIKYLFFFIRSLKLLKLKSKKIIIGDTMARYKHYILYLLNPNAVIAIDDGIKSVYSFNENLNFCLPKKFFNKLSFVFTGYDLNFTDLKFYINKPKKKLRQNIKNDLVWFIGQPLIEDNRLSLGQLRNYFDILKEKFINHEIVYFKHPREITNYNYQGIKFIKNTEISFEDFFDQSNFYPKTLVTFYSTSIDYCVRSSKSAIDFYFFQIKVDDRVKKIYEYLKRIGVRRIN